MKPQASYLDALQEQNIRKTLICEKTKGLALLSLTTFFYEPIISLLVVGSTNAPRVYPPVPCEHSALPCEQSSYALLIDTHGCSHHDRPAMRHKS